MTQDQRKIERQTERYMRYIHAEISFRQNRTVSKQGKKRQRVEKNKKWQFHGQDRQKYKKVTETPADKNRSKNNIVKRFTDSQKIHRQLEDKQIVRRYTDSQKINRQLEDTQIVRRYTDSQKIHRQFIEYKHIVRR